jgi:hypothetical protein
MKHKRKSGLTFEELRDKLAKSEKPDPTYEIPNWSGELDMTDAKYNFDKKHLKIEDLQENS